MDRTVSLKQQRCCDIPDFVSSDPQRPTTLLWSERMSQGDYRVQPKRNGVPGHPFLTPTHWDEQTFNTWTILLRPGQVFVKGSDGAEQQFIPITTNEVTKEWHQEFLEARVRDGRILGLSRKVRKKGEGTRSPITQVTNTKGKAMQLTNPLGQCKSNQKLHLPGKMFVWVQLEELKRRHRQTPENEREVPDQRSYLLRWTQTLKTPEHTRYNWTSSQFHPRQGKHMAQGCPIALDCRHGQAEFLTKEKKELCYPRDRSLAGIDTMSTAPTEEPGPLRLV